jgi:hypothetical protein
MKIKKFNELYEVGEKPKWQEDGSNYYTFNADITIKASSQEEAEDKMEIIANNPDMQLGRYDLDMSTEGGEFKAVGYPKKSAEIEEPTNIADESTLESKRYKKR